MLTIVVPGVEMFDEGSQTFITVDTFTLELEHSLVSLSKWEQKYERPFLDTKEKTTKEVLDYVKMMALDPNIPPEVFLKLSDANILAINGYLDAKMTATWFSEAPGAPQSRDIITAELIYYWMISFQIPFECEHWHLNRLFTLIRVCNVKSSKPKKMSRAEIAQRQRDLNEQRKKALGTSG